jgi:peptidoglycan/LPS O-acetylase OafA/YrhL
MTQGKLDTIQYLRGIAALSVVVAHCLIHAAVLDGRGDLEGPARSVVDGAFGVFVFFVISGFIMVHVSGVFGSAPAAGQFLGRRFLRIAPLYWVCTLLMLVLMVVDDGTAVIDFGKLLMSFAFIPYDFADDRFRPVLMVGWTLNYEMFFYALFAIALFLKKRLAIVFLVLSFLGLVIFGGLFPPQSSVLAAWTRPIILLFLSGALIGFAWARWNAIWPSLPPAAGLSAIAVVVLAQLIAYNLAIGAGASDLTWRPFDWTAAIALVLIGLSTRPLQRSNPASKSLIMLGDSSYSLYLSHPLTIAVLAGVWNRLPFAPPTWVFAVVAVPTCIVGGWVVYRLVEQPLARWIKMPTARRLEPSVAR